MSLTNYLIVAGEGSSQNKTGRFFNLLTCFNPVKIVIKNRGKELISTKASAGMSFSFDVQFDEIEFYSDTTQSITYWASETKLNYESGSTKESGAAFINSHVAGAAGGNASVLVAANERRRRVMLESVDDSVWVGGEGVTSIDGWELKKGERLELDIAGDVFSWWTDSVVTILKESAGFEGSIQLPILSLPKNGTQLSSLNNVQTGNVGKWIGFDGELNNGQVCYIGLRNKVDGVVPYFDVYVPAGKNTLVFNYDVYFSDGGGINPSIGVSWGDVDDISGCILWKSISSASGQANIIKSGKGEIFIGDSEVPRFKRVFFWDSSVQSYLGALDTNVIPARKVKVIELNN